jgi:molybdenum cofactor cytidylyltransferase
LEKLQPTFIQNIDNPFTNPAVLDKLTAAPQQADYILPTFNSRGGHPFLVSERILKRILEEPDHEMHLKSFLQSFDTLRIPVNDENILTNINSPEQYKLHFPS